MDWGVYEGHSDRILSISITAKTPFAPNFSEFLPRPRSTSHNFQSENGTELFTLLLLREHFTRYNGFIGKVPPPPPSQCSQPCSVYWHSDPTSLLPPEKGRVSYWRCAEKKKCWLWKCGGWKAFPTKDRSTCPPNQPTLSNRWLQIQVKFLWQESYLIWEEPTGSHAANEWNEGINVDVLVDSRGQ